MALGMLTPSLRVRVVPSNRICTASNRTSSRGGARTVTRPRTADPDVYTLDR